MAKFKIEFIETKGADWKVASLSADGKTISEASINRTSKKGEVFPNFDNLMAGQEIEGEPWQSSGGKWYIFPPKQETNAVGASGAQPEAYRRPPSAINVAMKKKEESIGKFQDAKEQSIKVASTFSGAWNMAIAEHTANMRINISGQTLDQLFNYWRQYLWEHFDCSDSDYPPKI